MSNLVSETANHHSDKLEYLLRAGYFAKGIVYAITGLLAASTAFGWFSGGEVGGTKNAIREIATQPFGNVLLVALIFGFFGYFLWRAIQSVMDTENKGSGLSGILQRTGFMISGLIYLGLGFYTINLTNWVFGPGNESDSSKRSIIGKIMSYEWGIWLIVAIGIGIIVVGLYQGYRAFSKSFKGKWKTDEMSKDFENVATRAAQVGITARAITFLIIGYLVIRSALRTEDFSQSAGLGQALSILREQTYGTWLLGIISIGLILYGMYCELNAFYRYMRI